MCVPTYVSVYIYVCGSIHVRVSIIVSYLYAYFEYTGSRFIFVHMYVCMYVCMYICICMYVYMEFLCKN